MKRFEKITDKLDEKSGYYISSYANIFYYSGFTSEDARLIITKNNRFLLTDSRYYVQAKKEAPDFEIVNISDNNLIKDLGLEKLGIEEDYLTVKEFAKLADKGIKTFQGGKTLSNPRKIKDNVEIKKIRKTEELANSAFIHVLDIIKAGVSENDIALELEYYMKKNGASSLAFDTIVASGKRGAMPHGKASDKIIENGELVTIDFGCVLDGYCSDMTRTVAVGNISDSLKEIYDVVKKSQSAALDAIRAGEKNKDIDAVARNIITEAGYGEYFGHALGHSVGIEIHENPNLSPKSEDVLETGNFVTVEPGIYIEDLGGVRIEDLVLVTEKGIENLTHSSKDLIIL